MSDVTATPEEIRASVEGFGAAIDEAKEAVTGAAQIEDPGATWLNNDLLIRMRDETAPGVGSEGNLASIDADYLIAMADEILTLRKERAELTAMAAGNIGILDGLEGHWARSLVMDLRRILSEYNRAYHQVQEIKKVVRRAESEQHHGWGGSLVDQVASMYYHMQNKVLSAERLYKSLREDMQVWTRALGIVVTSVGNAGTHREKDARLRGVIEIIESATGSIRESRDQDSVHWLKTPDIFASDYPVREYKQRIYELENEIKRLNQSAGDDTDDYDGNPF